jgi:hypothetical protein
MEVKKKKKKMSACGKGTTYRKGDLSNCQIQFDGLGSVSEAGLLTPGYPQQFEIRRFIFTVDFDLFQSNSYR